MLSYNHSDSIRELQIPGKLMKTSSRNKQNLDAQTKFRTSDLKRMDQISQEAIAKYIGDLSELESALGMLPIGHQYGWRVLYLLHSKATIRKYEEILGINVREEFPEAGPSAERNNGYRLIQKIGKFWKVVSGEEKIPDKRMVD